MLTAFPKYAVTVPAYGTYLHAYCEKPLSLIGWRGGIPHLKSFISIKTARLGFPRAICCYQFTNERL